MRRIWLFSLLLLTAARTASADCKALPSYNVAAETRVLGSHAPRCGTGSWIAQDWTPWSSSYDAVTSLLTIKLQYGGASGDSQIAPEGTPTELAYDISECEVVADGRLKLTARSVKRNGQPSKIGSPSMESALKDPRISITMRQGEVVSVFAYETGIAGKTHGPLLTTEASTRRNGCDISTVEVRNVVHKTSLDPPPSAPTPPQDQPTPPSTSSRDPVSTTPPPPPDTKQPAKPDLWRCENGWTSWSWKWTSGGFIGEHRVLESVINGQCMAERIEWRVVNTNQTMPRRVTFVFHEGGTGRDERRAHPRTQTHALRCNAYLLGINACDKSSFDLNDGKGYLLTVADRAMFSILVDGVSVTPPALAKSPKALGHLKRGETFAMEKLFQQAMDEFTAGLQLSGDPVFLLALAEMLEALAKLEAARDKYTEYLATKRAGKDATVADAARARVAQLTKAILAAEEARVRAERAEAQRQEAARREAEEAARRAEAEREAAERRAEAARAAAAREAAERREREARRAEQRRRWLVEDKRLELEWNEQRERTLRSRGRGRNIALAGGAASLVGFGLVFSFGDRDGTIPNAGLGLSAVGIAVLETGLYLYFRNKDPGPWVQMHMHPAPPGIAFSF